MTRMPVHCQWTFTILPRLEADHCRQGFSKEGIFRTRLLEALQIWYAKFPSSKKRGRSLLAGRPPDSVERGLLDYPWRGTGSWSRCWPRCRGRQARWSWRSRYCSPCWGRGCSINDCLSRNQKQEPAFRSGTAAGQYNTGICWPILYNLNKIPYHFQFNNFSDSPSSLQYSWIFQMGKSVYFPFVWNFRICCCRCVNDFHSPKRAALAESHMVVKQVQN